MLIACSECGRQISDKAPACPHCGNPKPAATPRDIPVIVTTVGNVTTQQTGKGWKLVQVLGVVLVLVGTVSCTAGREYITTTIVAWLIGSALFLFGRLGAWWRHG